MILRQRWRSQGTTYVLCLFTVHWPITNASTPLTVTPYWWQRSPIELRRRKSFSLCKFNKIDAYFNMHLQLSLKVFIFPQCGACINAPYKVLLLTCVVNWFKESFLFSPVVSALGSESVEPLFIEVQVFFVFFSSKDLKSLNDKDRVRHLTEISTFFNNFFR